MCQQALIAGTTDVSLYMIRRLYNILTIAAGLFFIALAVLAIPSFFDAEFKIVNNSAEVVSVTAVWGSNVKKIGEIQSMASYQFSVDDEASMTFIVNYTSGKVLESDPVYFTSGITVNVTVSNEGVDVGYDDQ